jgi:hypothetical protein
MRLRFLCRPEVTVFEERHQAYKMLTLKVVAQADGTSEVSGALVSGLRVGNMETVP